MLRQPKLWVMVAVLFGTLCAADAADRVVSYQIVNAREIPKGLTEVPGDAEAGRQLYFDRTLTGCSGCHGSPGGPGAEADPNQDAAPSLQNLARRMSPGTARLWLVAPSILRPDTRMPAYYAVGQRSDPKDPRYGEPILSAQEIENILAYLLRQGR
ncbi:MAG: cytochrome c [Pseudomonadota bacterium]